MAKAISGNGTMTFRKAESLAVLLLAFLLQEIIARAGVVSPLYFPPVSKIATTLLDLTASGVLPMHVLRSLQRMSMGYVLVIATIIPLGILMGISQSFYNLFEPLVEVLRPLPPPAIIPLSILFLGIDDSMKVFVAAFACSFPVLSNTIDGIRSVHPVFLYTGRTFGLTRWQLVRKVVLPSAVPQILSGLRTSLPICLIVTILSEMTGSVDGIGYFLLYKQRTFCIPEMYAGIMMLGLVGCVLNKLFLMADLRLIAWHTGWKTACE